MERSTHTPIQASRAKSTRKHSKTSMDAVALLKADHKQVQEWFDEFEKSSSKNRKATLAQKICKALQVHTEIEEEIFYPAYLEATQDRKVHHEAEIEHAEAKDLIAKIRDSSPEDDYFDAKVHVLSEMIRHHVREEEKRDGMFARARASNMDLGELGRKLQARKDRLMAADSNEVDNIVDPSSVVAFV